MVSARETGAARERERDQRRCERELIIVVLHSRTSRVCPADPEKECLSNKPFFRMFDPIENTMGSICGDFNGDGFPCVSSLLPSLPPSLPPSLSPSLSPCLPVSLSPCLPPCLMSRLGLCAFVLTPHNRDVIVGTGAPAWKNQDVWFCNKGVAPDGKWLGMERCQHPDLEEGQTHGMALGDIDGDGREDLVYNMGGFPGYPDLIELNGHPIEAEQLRNQLGDDRGGIILIEDVVGLGSGGLRLGVSLRVGPHRAVKRSVEAGVKREQVARG